MLAQLNQLLASNIFLIEPIVASATETVNSYYYNHCYYYYYH